MSAQEPASAAATRTTAPGGVPASEAPATDPLIGRKLADRYQIVRPLGQGGMGRVYEARTPNGERLAVKVLDADETGPDSDARRRFLREARVLMGLASAHIVRIVDADTSDAELPFIAMELVEGSDLRRVILERGALEPAVVARLFVQACRGLEAAHRVGLVHRDIKPANLLLADLGTGEIAVKVCDFGIAKRLDQAARETSTELTRTGGVMGSPLYMSPEQAKNAKNVDVRTDVWSLGVSMYEALAGDAPWPDRATVGELILAICTEPVPHLQDRAPWVPAELAEVVHGALAKRPERRPASMQELASAIEAACPAPAIVRREDLRSVAPDTRARVAPRASLGDSTTVEAPAQTLSGEARPRPRRPLLAFAAALLGMALAAWALLGGSGATEPPSNATSADRAPTARGPTSSVPPPARHRVRVTILPSGAEVLVNGLPSAVEDGAIWLEGEAGERFALVATAAGRTVGTDVVIGRDGSPTPATLAVPEASPSSRTAPPVALPPAPPALASVAAGSSGAPTGESAPAASEASPPRFKDEWR
jgi:serine/threonine-protein kinase